MTDDDGSSEETSDDSEDVEFTDKWDVLTRLFNMRTSCLDLYCIDFSASTVYERKQLKLPRHFCGQKLCTASFFCKEQDDWFIFRVILPVDDDVHETNSRDILRTLTKKALNMYTNRARTKYPLIYLRDIRLP